MLSFLPEMVHLQDEPIADPVCVPVYYVSELARRQRRDRLPGRARGPTSSSGAIPSGSGFYNCRAPTAFPYLPRSSALGWAHYAAAGKDQTVHYEWLRRGR